MKTTIFSAQFFILTSILIMLFVFAHIKRHVIIGWLVGTKREQLKVEASAIILNITPTGKYQKQKAQVKIQVQVIPAVGRNFVAELKAALSIGELAYLEEGKHVRVCYNPLKLATISLVDA